MCLQRLFAAWKLDDVLRRYRGLSIAMDDSAALVLSGTISFTAAAPGLETISDSYHIRIAIPESFPSAYPRVHEMGDRIDRRYHRLTDGSFCLGSPARVRLLISEAPTLAGFIEKCVIPYLYGYSYFVMHGYTPFGELAHGDQGLIDDYKRLLCVPSAAACATMLSLIGRKRRVANKRDCPCGSGRRLGRCHHRIANRLRVKLGRGWCRREANWLTEEYGNANEHRDPKMRLRASTARPRRTRKEADRTPAPNSSAALMNEKDESVGGGILELVGRSALTAAIHE